MKPSTASARASRLRRRTLARIAVLSLLAVLAPAAGIARAEDAESAARAQTQEPVPPPPPELPVPESGEDPVFSLASPIGAFEYFAGRGMRIGDTGLNVGGFTTLEFDKEEGEHGELELDALNLLVLFEPNPYIRGFAELEIGDLFVWETQQDSVDFDASFSISRLYFDLAVGDPLSLRMGKFQTPIGRWNLVPAEPFVWTAEEPAFTEFLFDEHTTGGSLLGSAPAAGGTLDYWVFGAFFDPLYPEDDLEPADHGVGGRLQYGQGFADSWSVGSSFMATEIDGDWSALGGVDAEVRWGPVLLTSEFAIQQGRIPDRDLWDFYLQAVVEVVPTFDLVGRYEHIDPSGRMEDVDIGDVGFAWIPKPWLHLKATYRFTSKQTGEIRRGLSASFSLVF